MQLIFNGSIQFSSDDLNLNFQEQLEKWIVGNGWELNSFLSTELPNATIAPIQVGMGTAIFHPGYKAKKDCPNEAKKRFFLSRVWDNSLPTLTIFMMNPSSADELSGDTTVEFMISFAKNHNFGSLSIINTSPIIKGSDTTQNHFEVDDEQWKLIEYAIKKADSVVLGWGEKGQRFGIPLLMENYPLKELLFQNLSKLKVFDFGKSNYCELYPKHPRPKLVHQRFSVDHQLKNVTEDDLMNLIPSNSETKREKQFTISYGV
ncbi:DUF1643 domain-containing protein [Bacillaceae bacterium S4-13-56]